MPKKQQPAGVGMTPSKTELGSFIRARRLELDLRQVPLAKQAGLRQELVSMFEIGKRKYLNDLQLVRLAKALQCDPEELRKRMPVKHTAQPTTELGKLIRSRREELGLSFSTFAKKLGITPQQAKALEVRKSPTIRYKLVKPLVSVLELDPSNLAKFAGITRKQSKSELGQLVRTRRKELGMSIGVLAEKLDVSKQFVNQIEFGQCRLSENDEMIAQLAQILELNVNELEAVRPTRRRKQMDNTNPLGKFLAAKRLEFRLSQSEVAERGEIQNSVVSGIETGRLRPSPNLLDKFAKALNCQIPPELIPPPRDHSNGRKDPRYRTERETELGKFVTTRRLELRLSQAQVADKASTVTTVISGIERGTYHLGGLMLEKISKALECEIPAELVPTPRSRGRRNRTAQSALATSVLVHLSNQNIADLERIKELSDIRANTEAVLKALKLLRILLEKQNDKYVVCLRKDKDVVELEFMF